VRQVRRNLGGDFAIATTDVEQSLVASQVELGNQLARPSLLLA